MIIIIYVQEKFAYKIKQLPAHVLFRITMYNNKLICLETIIHYYHNPSQNLYIGHR